MKLEYAKRYCTVVILTILLLPLNSVKAQNTFNGKLKFKIQNQNGKTNYITYYSQNGNMRMEMPGMGGRGYIILHDSKMDVIMPAQKMYIEYSGDLNKMMSSNSMNNNSADTKSGSQDKTEWEKMWEKLKTSNTKTILGYKCTEFIMPKDDGGTTHIWTTKELGNIIMMQNPMGSSPFINEIKKMGAFFPLLSEELDSNGKVISRFEVVEINKGKLDKGLFKIPDGYKKMSIPGMK